jgi:hypothetical protein
MQVIISPIFSGLGRVIKILLDKMCRRCYSKDGGVNAQNRRFAQGETMGNHSVYIITNLKASTGKRRSICLRLKIFTKAF